VSLDDFMDDDFYDAMVYDDLVDLYEPEPGEVEIPSEAETS
jgi:hypothetical protein